MAVNNASNYWKDFQDFLKEKYRKRELEDQRELDKLLCSMYALLQLVKDKPTPECFNTSEEIQELFEAIQPQLNIIQEYSHYWRHEIYSRYLLPFKNKFLNDFDRYIKKLHKKFLEFNLRNPANFEDTHYIRNIHNWENEEAYSFYSDFKNNFIMLETYIFNQPFYFSFSRPTDFQEDDILEE